MARPKGSINKAKELSDNSEAKIEDVVTSAKTTIKEVKVVAPKVEEYPLKKGDLFLLVVNGIRSYWTKSQGLMMFQRNSHDIEIPKGSSFIPPANSKCKGCG
jgi:hypothetical protein